VADEYYLRARPTTSSNVDAVTVGRVLSALQALFDRYWNSDPVYPLESVARSPMSKGRAARVLRGCHRAGQDAAPRAAAEQDVLGHGPIYKDLDAGKLDLIWGSASSFARVTPTLPSNGCSRDG